MNLNKLFELQRELDEHIVKEKGLEGQDLLPKKILSLQVELGELCNCWRGFKFWSNNREPRLKGYKEIKCKWCNGSGDDGSGVCPDCKCEGYVYKEYNPLLEEYVDCLHFILSIGLEKDFVKLGYNESAVEGMKRKDITSQFNYLFDKVGDFSSIPNHNNYMYIVSLFIGLGEMLGFTWEQIEQAYLDKNKINHERQENSY